MKMSNTVYDILNKLQRWLPGLGTLYLAVSNIWKLPFGDEINKTIVAVATFLAFTLEVSSSAYYKGQYDVLNYNDYSAVDKNEVGRDG